MANESNGRALADTINAYKQVLATPEGHVVVQDLMNRFGFSRRSTFRPDNGFGKATRPEDTIYYEGQRSVLVHIGVMLDADPAQVIEQEDTKNVEIDE